MRLDLRKRLFLSFVSVIVALSLLGSVVGVYLIDKAVIEEAQNRVRRNLRAAWAAYKERDCGRPPSRCSIPLRRPSGGPRKRRRQGWRSRRQFRCSERLESRWAPSTGHLVEPEI